MGAIFRPGYKDAKGNLRQSSIWWIRFYANGQVVRESTETADYDEAIGILKRKEGDATRWRRTQSSERQVLFSELLELVTMDYDLNHYSSADDIELRLRLHLAPFFGKMKAIRVGETDIDRYTLMRQREGAKNSTINRELATVKRAFVLGVQKRIVSDRPYIRMLEENNVRQGFFEPEQFRAVVVHLPDRMKPVARFAYITGWRRGEILTLQWRQVDFEAGIVRLEPGTTKNREARVFPFTAELRTVLEEQRAKADILKRKGIITPWVFFYPKGVKAGKNFADCKHSWTTACRKAGSPGRLMHDFRRTAVRNLVRAGVPEMIAMKMTGHKTRSVFDRYNIVDEGDLFDAARRLELWDQQRTSKVTADCENVKAVSS